MHDPAVYLQQHGSRLESAVASALQKTLQEGPADPVSCMGRLLLRSSPQRTRSDLEWAKSQALASLHKPESAAAGAKPMTKEEAKRASQDQHVWRLKEWLDTLNVTELLADLLLKRLRDDDHNPELELPFMKALASSYGSIATTLEEGRLLHELAYRVQKKAEEELVEKDSRALSESGSKFHEHDMMVGSLSSFFEGLEGLIGMPNPNLREAMENEHCQAKDRHTIFCAHNCAVARQPSPPLPHAASPPHLSTRQPSSSLHKPALLTSPHADPPHPSTR